MSAYLSLLVTADESGCHRHERHGGAAVAGPVARRANKGQRAPGSHKAPVTLTFVPHGTAFTKPKDSNEK